MTYRADIDGLRALAITLVIVFHFDIFSSGKAGFIGVDIFFVLSGFLITGLIARDLQAGAFKLSQFFYRRVRRLYPAVTVTLVLYLAFAYLYFLPDLMRELALEAVLSQLYVVNIYFWRSVNYFGLQAQNVPLLHMWSLAIEEQFYLLFPLFCLALHKLWPGNLARLGVALAVLMVGSFALGVFAAGWKPVAAFYLLPTRGWELLAGAVLAVLTLHRTPSASAFGARQSWLLWAGPLGLALVAASLVLYTPQTRVPGWFALLPVSGAVLLLLGGFRRDAPVTRLLSTPIPVWVGKISYPLYLVHWPVLVSVKQSVPQFTLGWRLAGLLISVVLAWGIYAAIERPIRQGRWLARPAAFWQGALVSTTLLLAVALGTVWQNGLPGRFDRDVIAMARMVDDEPHAYRRCEYRANMQLGDMCKLGDPAQPATALLMGDSHAFALSPAFDLFWKNQGQAGRAVFRHACMPVVGHGDGGCKALNRAIVDQARAADAIKTVYVVSIWRSDLSQDTGARAKLGQSLAGMVAQLRDAGKQVVLVDPLFGARAHVPLTLAKNLAFGRDWPVDKAHSAHLAEVSQMFEVFDAATRAGARRVSLIDALCADGTCRATYQGRPVFTDSNHAALGMAGYFADVLAQGVAGPE